MFSKNTLASALILTVPALIAEFLLLVGTVGVSLPWDRYSAVSTLKIETNLSRLHFITDNKRFTVIQSFAGPRLRDVVLRESFRADQADGVEGPPEGEVTVERLDGRNITWRFEEPGHRGEVVTDNLYKVVKYGCCDAAPIYAYFSQADGHKLRTARGSELSRDDLEALDRSISR